MTIKGIDLYQIFNGKDYDGLIIYNPTLIYIAIAILVVTVALAFFFNFKGAKIANKAYDKVKKKTNPNYKFTQEEKDTIKRFDILKVASLVIGVGVILFAIFTGTTQLTAKDKIKDSEKFNTHYEPLFKTMKKVDGKVVKSGDTYVLTQTVKGSVKGNEFVSEGGNIKIAKDSLSGFNNSIKEVKLQANLKDDTEVTVKDSVILGGTDVQATAK